ncbi:MAG: TolC family outer membrane protein [Gammaproteobacteria bacterium]|nr:TolC family outer membrane protein [Gammaproteobacteria bacterium]
MKILTSLLLAVMAASALMAVPARGADLWDVYQLALKNDPTFAQAQANYQATLENKPIARAGYLPNVTLSGSRNITKTSGQIPLYYDPNTNTYVQANASNHSYTTDYTAQLTQPIFNWAAWENIKQADASVAQAQAQFIAAQQDLIVRTATAYFNVITARDTLAADHAATLANQKQLDQTQAKYRVGMSAVTDVQNAQAAYDQSVANEIAAQQQVISADESLRAITGQPVGELQEPVTDMPLRTPNPDNTTKWVDTALQQNPNLMAAQAGAKVASANVSIKRSGHYPTLDLVLSHNKNDNTQESNITGASNVITQAQNNTGNTAILQLNVPIFSGGGVSAQVTQAERQYDAAMDQVQLITRQTVQQTRTSYLGVLTGISQVKALRQSVKSNQTSLQAMETGMQVGTRTIVDVLLARQNLVTAQTNFAQSRDNYLTSLLQLKQAAGILSPQDLKQINVLLQVPTPMPSMDIPAASSTTDMPPALPPKN